MTRRTAGRNKSVVRGGHWVTDAVWGRDELAAARDSNSRMRRIIHVLLNVHIWLHKSVDLD